MENTYHRRKVTAPPHHASIVEDLELGKCTGVPSNLDLATNHPSTYKECLIFVGLIFNDGKLVISKEPLLHII